MKHANSLSQQLELRQRLVPQQLRLVGLLEASTEEVEQEIARELDENPALERVPEAEPRYSYPPRAAAPEADFQPQTPNSEPTLREYLLEQLADVEPRMRLLATYMIGALDSNGYFTRTLPQLGADIDLETDGTLSPSPQELREAYDALRALDPAGVGAQDLRDCLLLQLKRLNRRMEEVADALEIVSHYFDIYSRRNSRKLSSATSIPLPRIDAADALIRSLNPKPGAAFAADPAQALGNAAVTPDFIVETDGERITVSMPNSLPELQIEESFRQDSEANAEAAAFVRDRRTQARSFIELLQRRQHTLMTIARAIVQMQAPFFLNGDDDSRIRPMVLRQVAEATGLDITMVSRAVAGKWLATPWGVYSLKSFFNQRTGADDVETSAREIEAALRQIIADEPPSAPLSDEALAAALASRGYKVARRTVAKYRTRLHILPARLRRK